MIAWCAARINEQQMVRLEQPTASHLLEQVIADHDKHKKTHAQSERGDVLSHGGSA